MIHFPNWTCSAPTKNNVFLNYTIVLCLLSWSAIVRGLSGESYRLRVGWVDLIKSLSTCWTIEERAQGWAEIFLLLRTDVQSESDQLLSPIYELVYGGCKSRRETFQQSLQRIRSGISRNGQLTSPWSPRCRQWQWISKLQTLRGTEKFNNIALFSSSSGTSSCFRIKEM